MRRFLIGGALCALALCQAPVEAGYYFGGNVGQASADVSVSDLDDGSTLSGSVDDTDTCLKVYGGFKVMRFFAVEAAWSDFGEISTTATSDGSGAIYAAGDVSSVSSANGFSVSALGTLPVGTKVRLFAKLGYLFWDGETTLTNSGLPGGSVSGSDDGEDAIYGAGVVWDYTGPGQARFEYEQGKLDELDVSSLSAGLSFRF